MDTFLRHPLVVVAVIAAIAIGFYYYASPYEKCMRHIGNLGADVSNPETGEVCKEYSIW